MTHHSNHGVSPPADTFFPEVFSIPTKSFIGYELKVWLPYFIKRHVFRRNIPKPPAIIEKAEKVDDDILVG